MYGGVSVYPEGLLAAVWYGAGEELPMGDYCSSAPPTATLIILIILIILISAARIGIANHSGYTELGGKELPRGFAVSLFGMTWAQSCRWVVLR